MRKESSNILPSNKVKNLGIIFDKHMIFDEQITYVCRRAYFHLYRINNLRKYLDTDTLKTIIQAFIFSTLDYCNMVYYNLPKHSLEKLQKLQNYAAKNENLNTSHQF